MACAFTDDEISQRRKEGLTIGCITISIVLFMLSSTDYISNFAKCSWVIYDVGTITANDYTIEIGIKKDFYEKFKSLKQNEKNEHPLHKNSSWATYFDAWLTKEMYERISN